MHASNHCHLGNARNEAFIDRCGCRDAQLMAVETSFAKEVTRPEEADDCLLAALRNNRELDLTLLDVKNRVRNVTLGKNNLILLTFRYCFSIANLSEKYFWIESALITLLHRETSVPRTKSRKSD